MDVAHRRSAERVRASLTRGPIPPAEFRRALAEVPVVDRDAWLDAVLEIDDVPDDGPALPRGCTPYLPCPTDTLLRALDHAAVGADDVFVDVGSGLGRAVALAHYATGAGAIGIEIQPRLVELSRALAGRLGATRVSIVEGDASRLTGFIAIGTVFFLYCPFSGQRLERVLDDLESIARTRTIRICAVALSLPPRPWLEPISPPLDELAVYRSAAM